MASRQVITWRSYETTTSLATSLVEGGNQMEQKKSTYIEKLTEASITYEQDKIEFVFQRAKLRLRDELEVNLLKTINPEYNKEFELTDDQLMIRFYPPPSYSPFHKIRSKSIQAKCQLAYNIVQQVENHALQRLKLIVSPKNMMFDQGLVPHFFHYGIRESLPPYQEDKERVWLETKAIVATIMDQRYDYETYIEHYETVDLSKTTKSIMEATTFTHLYTLIEENIAKDVAYEKTVIHIPARRWKFNRYSLFILTVLLIPAIIYTIYAVGFKIPETEAYVESNKYFLKEEYSSVVETLEKYNQEKMPYVVQYELASAYIANESLTEAQKDNVQHTITLQSDKKYFLYWIHIGRGESQEAIDTARLLEDRDLIIYGLLKQREQIKADQSLSGSEREEELKDLEQEMQEYKDEMEQEELEQEEEELEKQDEKKAKETEQQSEKETNKTSPKTKTDKTKKKEQQ